MNSETKETSKVQQIYAAIIASFILNFVPSPLVQIIASLVFLGVFIALYVMRKFGEPESLTDNHTTYLIRTVWIGGLFVILGVIAGAVYFVSSIGMEEYVRLGQIAAQSANPSEILSVYQSRYPDEIFISGMLTFAPGTIYMTYRFARGLARAIKGYRIAKPLNWL